MTRKALTKENILHLAKLAKLKLTDEEVEKYLKQLEDTVEYIDNLNELNTDSVEPTSQTTGLSNVGFDDGIKNTRNIMKKGYFKVKRIM